MMMNTLKVCMRIFEIKIKFRKWPVALYLCHFCDLKSLGYFFISKYIKWFILMFLDVTEGIKFKQ
jgi:hypothetical protein